MCNLYSLTKSQDAIRQLSKAMRDTTGNLPIMPGIFPDAAAPVVRTAQDGVRELAMLRSTRRHERGAWRRGKILSVVSSVLIAAACPAARGR